MIHQLKRMEPNTHPKEKYKLLGISKDSHDEWLWTATLKKGQVQYIFVSKRPKLFINGTEAEWRSQLTVPEEIEQYVASLAIRIGDLFKSVDVS